MYEKYIKEYDKYIVAEIPISYDILLKIIVAKIKITDDTIYNVISSNFMAHTNSVKTDENYYIESETEKIIVLNNGRGLYIFENIIKIIKNHFETSSSAYLQMELMKERAIDIMKRMLNMISDSIKSILTKYNTKIEAYSVTITNLNIVPNIAIDKNMKIRTIIDAGGICIKNIIIGSNVNNKIVSVTLDSVHPNADNKKDNSYCLGDMRFKELNLESVDEIIKNLYTITIYDSYWFSDSIKIK